MDPISLLTVASVGTSLISGGLSLAGGYQAGANAEASGLYQSRIAKNRAMLATHNAHLADIDAARAQKNVGEVSLAGQREGFEQDLEAASQIGDIIGAQSASGLTVGGPILDTMRRLAARDRDSIARTRGSNVDAAIKTVQGFKMEAADLRSGAASSRADAKMAVDNAKSEAGAARMQGWAGFVQGLGDSGKTLISASQSTGVQSDWNNFWARRKK